MLDPRTAKVGGPRCSRLLRTGRASIAWIHHMPRFAPFVRQVVPLHQSVWHAREQLAKLAVLYNMLSPQFIPFRLSVIATNMATLVLNAGCCARTTFKTWHYFNSVCGLLRHEHTAGTAVRGRGRVDRRLRFCAHRFALNWYKKKRLVGGWNGGHS